MVDGNGVTRRTLCSDVHHIGWSWDDAAHIASANQNGDVALHQVRRTFIRRGIYLLVFGTLLLVIWPGEILRLYGVAMLIACCFITAP